MNLVFLGDKNYGMYLSGNSVIQFLQRGVQKTNPGPLNTFISFSFVNILKYEYN